MAEVLHIFTAPKPKVRVTRARSLPTLPLNEVENESPASAYPASPDFHEPIVCPELPDDPRAWTSAHVASYLTYCLRLYPPAVINDLSRFVRADTSLNGRRFLRLKEDQLRYMGFNERWVKLIMLGVKALRRETLKGKILAKAILEVPEPLHDDLVYDNNSNDYDREGATDSSEERASETTELISSTAATVSPGSEKDVYLTSDDRWFTWDKFDRLRGTLHTPFSMLNDSDKDDNDDARDNDFAPSVRSLSFRELVHMVRNNSRELLPDFAKPHYANGFAHGALVGGVVVWTCYRIVANLRN